MTDLLLPLGFVGSLLQREVLGTTVGQGCVEDDEEVRGEGFLNLSGEVDTMTLGRTDIIELIIFEAHRSRDDTTK